MTRSNPWLSVLAAAVLAALCGTALAGEPSRGDGFSAGLNVQPGASAADIGLPIYPGATPERDGDKDSEGASISLWGGAFGMQLHVLKLRSSDNVDRVAGFYRDVMASQGRVLDCSAGAPPEPPPPASGSKLLRCDSDHAKPGGRLFKVGLPGGVRMVAIEPGERGTRVQLLRLMLRGE